MLQKITDRLEKECEENINDRMKRVICNHVLEKLSDVPEDVLEKIAENDKLTLAGAIEKMRNAAQKNSVKGCSVLSDEEGYAIVDGYFGIDCESAAEKTNKAVSLFDLI